MLDMLSDASRHAIASMIPPGFELIVADTRDIDRLQTLIADADYAITGQVAVPAALLQSAKRLRLLHKWGVGVDNIDLEAARALGISVARTTGGNAIPVAEFTLGLMIATLRNLAWAHAELMQGRWNHRSMPHESLMLHGRTVGLIGFGATGQRVAHLLAAFGCRVLYTRRTPPDESSAQTAAEFVPIDRLLAESDIVSLHCPLNADTAGLIDRQALSSMQRHAVLINVSRGGVVNESDLHWALSNRVILGAALDVFETEPLPGDSPLLQLANLVVSPHLAGITADNLAPTISRILANFVRTESGEPIPAHEQVIP